MINNNMIKNIKKYIRKLKISYLILKLMLLTFWSNLLSKLFFIKIYKLFNFIYIETLIFFKMKRKKIAITLQNNN